MGNEAILTELTAILRAVLRDPALDVTPDTTADDVPSWDSMSHIALVVAAEAQFGVRFRAAEIEALGRVGDFVTLIAAKRAAATARKRVPA